MTKATKADRFFPPSPPLVERLRQYVEIADGDRMTVILCDDLTEAATELEKLTAALDDIASGLSVLDPYHVANEALGRVLTS